eukprot:UN07832
MSGILCLGALLGLSSVANVVGSVSYTVRVVRAEGLPDEYMDTWFTTNKNDVYVEVFGYGSSDGEIKEFKTSTIDGSDTPEWNEEFIFDEANDDITAYSKFLFKLYDSDTVFGLETGADYLGETCFYETSVVTDCGEIFSEIWWFLGMRMKKVQFSLK